MVEERYLIDETTRWLLDQIKLNNGDVVTVAVSDEADDETETYSLVVKVNGVQQPCQIAYSHPAEFENDLPMLNDYFARRLGVKNTQSY